MIQWETLKAYLLCPKIWKKTFRFSLSFILMTVLIFTDLSAVLVSSLPFDIPNVDKIAVKKAKANSSGAIKVESFDQNVTIDGSTFTLDNDVGATSSAFIRMLTGTRKTSAGPTGSTADAGPDIGTVGLVLSDTATVTVKRANTTEVKVMGEVWRYEGGSGSGNEFIVRDRVEVSLTGSSISTPISGIADVDKVVPFVTGYTVNNSSVSDWEQASIAAHIDDSGNLIVSRNNSGTTATVYVDVVEFTGEEWTVCHGYSNSHDTAEETITLNTDPDGQGGSTCDVTDWSTATIIEATMEGDSSETGLSDTLALVRPGATTDTVIFDLQQDSSARNDGKAWIHVLKNDGLVVNRASSTDLAEGNGTYGTASWPSGATTTAAFETLALEWFTDTSGVGTAHMRGGLHASLAEPSPVVYNDGDTVLSTDYDSTIIGNFQADIIFSASPEGVVYEAGGTGTGAFVGYNDAGDFIIRAGNGGSTAPADAARIVITTSDYDFSGRTGEMFWTFDQNNNSVDLSFDEDSDGSIEYSTSTTAVSAWANWSGGNDGAVGNWAGASIAGSEITVNYDFNGTISEVRFLQSSFQNYSIQHWIHRSGNTVGVDYGVIELYGLEAITEDTVISATGTQATEADIPTTDYYVGGAFTILENNASRNVTNINITESGSVDGANGLDNVELWYDFDTSSPYNCKDESYDGDETQFGSTDTNGFSGANGISSFTDTVAISPTQSMCVYVVLDVTASSTDGQTINVSIDDASTDVTTTGGGSVSPSTPEIITGSTILRNAELTQIHYNWRNDDGSETTATSIEGAEDIPSIGFANGATRRLRLEVSAEGSTSSEATQYKLEYAQKSSTCEAASTWVDVGTGGGGDWDVINTTNLTDGNDTTNVVSQSNGGVTDENNTFLSPNGGQKDTSSQTGNITLTDTQFVELEYAIEPTISAPQGNTYCFRVTDAGTPLRNYDVYPEGTISADIDVSASSSQVATLDAGSTGQYVGGTFVVERPGSTRTLDEITITETGTIDATLLSNPTLYYDISASDCTGESYGGGESNVTGSSFSGADGISTFSSLGINLDNSNTFCGYVVFDVDDYAVDGKTINIEISDPSTDVKVTSSSVGPSTAISPSGSTTIAGSILTQTHYHWRNDNGDESDTGATSATGGIEDTAILDVPKESNRRLRLQVSNEGSVTSNATQYNLEYGTKISSCNLVGNWINVGDSGGAFDMSLSSNISDGNTTDIDNTVNGAMTEENTTFVGTGALRETEATSSAITLASTEYTELEYSIEATADSGYDTTYCFRVSAEGQDLPAYDNYAELTTREKQDFYVQRGTETVTGTSLTLTAGVDYTAPAATTSAFVRITSSHMTGAADNIGTNGQNADDVTAYISDQSDITSSFTIGRPSSATSNTRVDWEIVEFVGLSGSDNEMIVRRVGQVPFLSSEFTNSGSTTYSVVDDEDAVVFITGQQNQDATTGNYNDSLFTSDWNTTTSQPDFERGDADVAADVSYAVVEFTGINWKIQRAEHTYTAAGTTETELITAIGSISRTFLHTQKRVGEGLSSIDEGGHLVYISSIGAVSFELQSGVDTPSGQTSVAWVIENTQIGTGAMSVYQSSGSFYVADPEPATYSVSIGATVNTSNSSISGNNYTVGTGTTYPRLHTGFTIASSTHYEVYRSDTNNDMDYRVEVIEWPVAETSVRQNYYRFYMDNDALDPTDPWPVGVTDLGENTSITANDDPLGEGDVLRIRMSLKINNATLPDNISSFKLQYGLQKTTCSAINIWNDVGAPGSGTIWRGYNTSIADGTNLATTTPAAGTLNLSVSDVAGTFEEQNNTAINPFSVDVGDDVEYDWAIEHNGAAQRTDYCFRMVYSDDTELDSYIYYPTLRTTGYTPIIGDWRWYNDEASQTPTTDLAAENTAPIDIANQNIIKLRVNSAETENAVGSNIKFALQYSQYADFSDGGIFVVSTSSCTENSIWCYADGAGVDNAIIQESVISTTDTCSAGVGNGCGTHNEAATTTSTFTHVSNAVTEFEFTIKQSGARANGVYYFRLYDTGYDDALVASSTYPSLVAEGPQLVSTISGVTSGQTIAGVTSDVSTTPTSIGFGSLPFGNSYEAIQEININTNSTEGYQLFMKATQQLENTYGDKITPVTGTNASPGGWSTVCDTTTTTSCFGYHTTDATLFEGTRGRFAPIDSYASLNTAVKEIMYSSIPSNDTENIIYRIEVTETQPAGDYETVITYIAVPTF